MLVVEASPGSGPPIASRSSAQSSAVCASGPTVSYVHETGITPRLGTRPVLGRIPVTPQSAAGIRTDPAVSVPSAPGTSPPATAAPLPPLEPPQIRSVSHGFRAGPNASLVVEAPQANSCVLSFPTTTAPAARSRATTVASAVGHVVGEHLRGGRRAGARDVDHVLDADRHPVERPAGRAERVGLGQGLVAAHGDEGVVRRVVPLDPLERVLHRLARRELAAADRGCQGGDGHVASGGR